MPSTYSSNLKIELQANGENAATWGDKTNTNLGTALEQAIVGYATANFTSDANLTLPYTDTSTSQVARALVLNVTSAVSLTVTRELIVPTIQKQYIVQNNTTGSQSITVKTAAGSGVTIPSGRKMHVYVDGTNVIQMFDFQDTLTLSGALSLSGGTANGVAYLNASKVVTSGSSFTFDGTSVNIGGNGSGARLVIRGTGATASTFSLEAATSAGATRFLVADDGLTRWYGTTNAETMRLDNAGNLGIGTASPSEKLEVSGTVAGALATRIVNLSSDSAAVTRLAMFTQGGTWNINANRSDFSLAFATGTTERMRLDSSGNLGLGVTPSAWATLTAQQISYGSVAATTAEVDVSHNAYYNAGWKYIANGFATNHYQTNGAYVWRTAPSGTAGNAISFTQAMTLDASGNLGIGTASPGSKLHVLGSAQVSVTSGYNELGLNGTYASASARVGAFRKNYDSPFDFNIYASVGSSGNAGEMIFWRDSANENARFDTSGNFGIGTTSPGKNLEVAAATDTTIRIRNTTTNLSSAVYGTLDWATSDSSAPGGIVAKIDTFDDFPGAGFGDRAALRFFTNNSTALAERMRLDSSGNLGIGTASPSYRLHVERPSYGVTGYFLANDGTRNPRLVIYGSSAGTTLQHTYSTGADALIFANGGAIGAGNEVGRFDASGNLGIGTTSPGGRLHITTASGNTEFVHDVTGSGTAARTSYQRGGVVQFLAGLGAWSGTDTYQIASSTGPLTTLDASGNLGIGTTSPAARLQVKSSLAQAVNIEGTTARGSGNIYAAFLDPTGRKGYIGYASGADDTFFVTNEMNAEILFQTNGQNRMRIDANGNVQAGNQAALATNATNGFLYVPTCAGTPTGTPTAITGMAPIVVNTTNNKLYFYSGGAWRDAGP